MQDCHHLARDLAIQAMTRRNDDQARAESDRFTHRHGASHPVASGRIRAGRNDPALIRFASHGECLAAQGGILVLLHGAEERIEIDMQDGARHGSIIR